ncbi:MAG: DMT family transporter, partial [Rhizobiaceae bacterium]|nr:DMT family transporter [Rhizobiaceae bacterium]
MSSTDVDTRLRARHAAPGATEYMLLIALSLAWGTSFMFTKVAVESVTPVTLIAVRTVIATIAMFGLFAFQGRLPRLTYREVGAFALVGLTANAAPLCLIAISVSHVPSGVTAVTMAV